MRRLLSAVLIKLFLCAAVFGGEPDRKLHEQCLYPAVLVWTSSANGCGVIVKCVPEGNQYRNTVLTVAHVTPTVKAKVNVWLGRYEDWSTLDRYEHYVATVVKADHSPDAAVLTFVSPGKLPTATIDPSPKLYIGNPIQRFGGGLSKAIRLDAGHISARRETIQMPNGKMVHGVIRASLLTSPGDSGGPVYDGYRLIGLDQSVEQGHPHISYVVPISFFDERDWK